MKKVIPQKRKLLTSSLRSKSASEEARQELASEGGMTGLPSPESRQQDRWSEPDEVSTFLHAAEFSKTGPLGGRQKGLGSRQRPSGGNYKARIRSLEGAPVVE